MRALQGATVVAALFMLTAAGAATAQSIHNETRPIDAVAGSMAVDPIESYGTFTVEDGIRQYRDVPINGSELIADDARLSGTLESMWNKDIDASGLKPVPSWGTMQISVPGDVTRLPGWRCAASGCNRADMEGPDGAWVGDFTGIQHGDYQPVQVRAFLIGEGAFEGLCATLDIEAAATGWSIEGVIHPLPMAG